MTRSRSGPKKARLLVEALEDRLALSTATIGFDQAFNLETSTAYEPHRGTRGSKAAHFTFLFVSFIINGVARP